MATIITPATPSQADRGAEPVHSAVGTSSPLDLAQGVRIVTGLVLIGWTIVWWQVTGTSVIPAVMTVATLLGGIAVIAVSAVPHAAKTWRTIDVRILAFTLVVMAMWLATQSSQHSYGTDEITTGQASATVLINGHNPYGYDLTHELNRFNLQSQVSTPLLNGSDVTSTSYPALSFLVYVPFGLLLGVGSPYALVADGAAWILLMILLWRLLDERVRVLVPLLSAYPIMVAIVSGGVTDVVYLPFLCLALHRWDAFLGGKSRFNRLLGPICLGLACSVKPTPWLIAPFLVAAVALEAARRGRRPLATAGRYALVAVGAFLTVNAPFIVMDPAAWAHGALLPLVQPLVPFGEGIVMLPLYLHIGGGHLGYLAVAGVAAVAACLGAFIAFYPRTVRLLPVLATVPVLFASRSLFNYFLYVAVLTLVHASNSPYVRRSTYRAQRVFSWTGRTLVVVGGAVLAMAVAAFVASPGPLQLSVNASTTAPAATAKAPVLTVTASNVTDAPVKPRFIVTSGGWMDPAWRQDSGPPVLAPHASATYRLVSSSPGAANLPSGAVYLVDAFADAPASVSTSPWQTVP